MDTDDLPEYDEWDSPQSSLPPLAALTALALAPPPSPRADGEGDRADMTGWEFLRRHDELMREVRSTGWFRVYAESLQTKEEVRRLAERARAKRWDENEPELTRHLMRYLERKTDGELQGPTLYVDAPYVGAVTSCELNRVLHGIGELSASPRHNRLLLVYRADRRAVGTSDMTRIRTLACPHDIDVYDVFMELWNPCARCSSLLPPAYKELLLCARNYIKTSHPM